MSTTSTNTTTSFNDSIVEQIQRNIRKSLNRKYAYLVYNFDIPGAKSHNVEVIYDTLSGYLSVEATSFSKNFSFNMNVFEKTVGPEFTRWTGKVELMPLKLEDGVLTVSFKCELWSYEIGRFEDK